MSLNDIADVVAGHDVSVHVCLALRTIKSSDVNLTNKLLTDWTLFGSVVLVHTHNDIAKGSGLEGGRKIE